MTKVKICGLSRLEDIEMVNQLLPDYIGFVFAKSRRQIDAQIAGQLKKRLNPKMTAVGVFVDEEIEIIAQLVDEQVIEMVQLHGTEDETYLRKLQACIQVPIIKAIAVSGKHPIADPKDSLADYLLFDGEKAGSGQMFDWNHLTNVTKPYFLAGGLHINNISQALLKKPFALDVSSGVEVNGVKDKQKIKSFIELVRSEARC